MNFFEIGMSQCVLEDFLWVNSSFQSHVDISKENGSAQTKVESVEKRVDRASHVLSLNWISM